jgi:tetraacyldisaccharide 4'-kinase
LATRFGTFGKKMENPPIRTWRKSAALFIKPVSLSGGASKMINPAQFRAVVSGQKTGLPAALARAVFRAAETPYTLAVSYRNRRFDSGSAHIERVEAPVISVGNITLGGTGKTPLVKWLARWLDNHGAQVAIVSRGYRKGGDGPNDEARELRQALPDVPHVQNADRVAAARAAIDYHGCNVILLDDGFQHRRLARDLDIVLLDAQEPFGFDHVFPRGTLREPVSGIRRADVVCLSRADAVTPSERQSIRMRVAAVAPEVAWCEMQHQPGGLVNTERSTAPFEALRGRRVLAFCGIGNPAGFRHTLTAADCELVGWREFPDHHAFSDANDRELSALSDEFRADTLVCTHKDLVKINRREIGGRPLWAITVEIGFTAGQEALEAALRSVISQIAPR